MPAVLIIALVLCAGVASFWLAWRLRWPAVPLLLLSGAALSHVLPPLSWKVFSPIIALAIALVFFEGGRSLGSRTLRHRHLVSHLVAIGPKVGWLLTAGLAHLLLGLPATPALLLGALLMIHSPYSVRAFVERLGGQEDMADVLCWETHILSCVGCAWSVLMFLILRSHAEHPNLLTTLALTLKVLAVGLGFGVVSAWVMLLIVRKQWAPPHLQPCVCLSLCLLNFGLAQAVFAGAGLVASGIMGYGVAGRARETIGELGSHLLTLFVAGAGITLGIYIPLANLAQNWLPRVAFAILLVLLVRPLLAYLGARKAGLSQSENRLLQLTAPRGVLTLGITVHLSQLLNDLGIPDALELIPIVYWCVLVSILGPWMVPTFFPGYLRRSALQAAPETAGKEIA